MQQKWSTTILKELMDLAGGVSWAQWKSHAQASGQPVAPGEENEARIKTTPSAGGAVLPTLQEFRAANISGSTRPKAQSTP